MDIEFERDGVKKMANKRFEDDLKAVGWTVVQADNDMSERDLLKAQADELGIEYPNNIKTDKLKGLIAEKA